MVVVSGNWVKNVATFPSRPAMVVMNTEVLTESDGQKMTARAVLICRPNSHPFQDRSLTLEQPVKVGRSVARSRATATNAIFDCKVLSRHHALLWYENGKFYLQDTKSSNGTFVNNNRLAAETEHHEVSSGDIVQFGVDVIENNRKVTHGCIIATLKLYLPDGKEAKASPSIVESNTHVVPLDELYKLHQIIQEAVQREQCLETKLTAMQAIVLEAKQSADESWQAYVGEERLLSRVSVLESKLQQAGKNWGEDKYREEINKLQDENATYQIAAKEALEKLHAERLQALAMATEQERCRITAEQELLLLREQLLSTQQEIEDLAQKFAEEQKKAHEEKTQLEQENWELQAKIDSEIDKCEKLKTEMALHKGGLDERIIYDDLKAKKELLAENECEAELNKTNGGEMESQNNHLIGKTDDNSEHLIHQNTVIVENEKHVHFDLPEESKYSHNGPDSPDKEENEKDDFDSEEIDSKTLKYKYQTAQNELKKKIELLETILESNKTKINDMEKSLMFEKEVNSVQLDENQQLKDELVVLQQKLKESSNENQQLRDRVGCIVREVEENEKENSNLSTNISYEELVNVEEELVVVKQRYVELNAEKMKLQKDLNSLREQYNKVCNSSYDKMYFYIAPLILMILYLVISAMIS